MTGAVRQQENANKAKMELAAVKAQASEVIGGLISLIKVMYVFADGLETMSFEGRPVADVVADLVGAQSAAEMLKAMESAP